MPPSACWIAIGQRACQRRHDHRRQRPRRQHRAGEKVDRQNRPLFGNLMTDERNGGTDTCCNNGGRHNRRIAMNERFGLRDNQAKACRAQNSVQDIIGARRGTDGGNERPSSSEMMANGTALAKTQDEGLTDSTRPPSVGTSATDVETTTLLIPDREQGASPNRRTAKALMTRLASLQRRAPEWHALSAKKRTARKEAENSRDHEDDLAIVIHPPEAGTIL